ncbi:MAG: beta-N-acetylhexosaminidase [Gammaproteobacteria bacterium]|nr:beta-N-acetylhexosaminidase [Gammaproteobacteria bacterium]
MSAPFLFADVDGFVLDAEDRDVLAHPYVAGVTLFARNYHCVEQLRALTRSIHAVKPDLLIAVDHEGGRVQRFINEFTLLPPAGTIGALFAEDENAGRDLAEAVGLVMAAELRAAGIDLCFAPVVDVRRADSAVIGQRALSRNPSEVARLAEALVAGMERGGLPGIGKHFPGHGGVSADSHLELPHDGRAWPELLDELHPYRHLSKVLSGVMTAHVVFDAVDPSPATFSARWLRTVLRDQLRFAGAVFSDDLSMVGAHGRGTVAERVRLALASGCDLALVCNDRAATVRMLDDPCMSPVTRLSALPSLQRADPKAVETGAYNGARRTVMAFNATLPTTNPGSG